MKLAIAALGALATLLPAAARDNGEWADSPDIVRQWFQSLMKPDNPSMSYRGKADAFEVEGDRHVSIISDGKSARPDGT
jgi:hypothetical protein